MFYQLRDLVPAWLGCVLLPLPALALLRSEDGRSMALLLFSFGSAGLVAYAFRHDTNAQTLDPSQQPTLIWHCGQAGDGRNASIPL
jgi:hypothetical protein